ncbi:MAG TPA: nuclear transport factor 2 family protein [Candidatus Acidoferrales bacterium]|nr:nuclear transport factor 2 family protein [Candidatus Acidoferrales bacterium]
MTGFIAKSIAIVLLFGGVVVLPSGSLIADDSQEAVLQADHALTQVFDRADKAEVEKLLDADFTWIFSDGRDEARADIQQTLPKPILEQQSGSKVTERTYGQIALVAVDRGSTHVLHIWVKRVAGWRALHFNEIIQATHAAPGGAAVPSEAGVVTPCINPCMTVPVKAATPAAQAALTALQQLDTGAANRDMKLWASRVLDDCLIVDSSDTRPITKAERITRTLQQKATGTTTNEAPPLVWARLYDFGDTVLMVALHQPYKSKPYYATRLWAKRDGRYQLAASYHTSIEDVPAFTLLKQLPAK